MNYLPLLVATEAVTPGMSADQGAAVSTAFSNAGSAMFSNFVTYLPVILGVAVIGFCVATAYKLTKKVKNGGR